MDNGVKGNERDTKFFTAEFFGVTLIIASFLLSVCLLFGRNVLFEIGAEVQYFLLGLFGYLSYPLVVFLCLSGFSLLFGKKAKKRENKKPAIILTLFFLALICLLNVATTKTSASDYGEYLKNAYESGRNGLSGVCAGGATISLLTFPFSAYLGRGFAIAVFSLIVALIVFVAFRYRLLSRSGNADNRQPVTNAQNTSDTRNLPPYQQNVDYGGYQGYPSQNQYNNNYPPYGGQPAPYGQPQYPPQYPPQQNGVTGNQYGSQPAMNAGTGDNDGFSFSKNEEEAREQARKILYGTRPPTPTGTYSEAFMKDVRGDGYKIVDGNDDDEIKHYGGTVSSPIRKTFNSEDYKVVDNSVGDDVTASEIFGGSSFDDDFGAEPTGRADDEKDKITSFFTKKEVVKKEPAKQVKPVVTESTDNSDDFESETENGGNEEYSSRLIENMPADFRYNAPPISLLKTVDNTQNNYEFEVFKAEIKQRILSTLAQFGVETEIPRVFRGPAVTRFDIAIPPDVPMSKVTKLQNDLNLRIAAKSAIRMIAPIPNTSYVGIEVPNNVPDSVSIKDIVTSEGFLNTKPFSLVFALGKDVIGRPVSLDIADMPHLLVTGTTGSGKSVCLNTMIISLITKYGPDELRFVIVDPKRVDLEPFSHIPHMMFGEIIEDVPTTNAMLTWAVDEMESRYRELAKFRAKNIKDYNARAKASGMRCMPRIVIIMDEFADIMLQDKKGVGVKVCAIAQKARAAGIHLVLAAQRPSVDIIEGPIKSNLPSRIVFKASSLPDSMTSLGEAGAEKLLGRGDCLYKTNGMFAVERVMGAYVSDDEMYSVIDYVCDHNKSYFDLNNWAKIKANVSSAVAVQDEPSGVSGGGSGGSDGNIAVDPLNVKAMRIGYDFGGLSVSFLQRKLGVGYPRAAKIIDWLTENNYITPNAVANKRQMVMPKEEFEEKFGSEN